MGKTTIAGLLRCLGVPVYDADAAVHRMMAAGGIAVPMIEASFPHVVYGGAVERPRLGARVFGDDLALERLEAILHPLVRREQAAFLRQCRRHRRPIAVLDIPLLFEIGAERSVDRVVVVSCPAFLQARRVLARPGMTPGKLAIIRQRQMPDSLKRRRADIVIPTGLGRRTSLARLKKMLNRLGR